MISITQFSQDCMMVTWPDIVYWFFAGSYAIQYVAIPTGLGPTYRYIVDPAIRFQLNCYIGIGVS